MDSLRVKWVEETGHRCSKGLYMNCLEATLKYKLAYNINTVNPARCENKKCIIL